MANESTALSLLVLERKRMWKRKVGELSFKPFKGMMGVGGLSVGIKADDLFSHFVSRKREELAYVLCETRQVLCPVGTRVSHICQLGVVGARLRLLPPGRLSANHRFHYWCRLVGNEETGARQEIFGEVIELRCGGWNPTARDGHVIGRGAQEANLHTH